MTIDLMVLGSALLAVPPLVSSNKAAFYAIGDLPGAQFLSSAYAASSSRPLRVVGTGHALHNNDEQTEGVLWTIGEGLVELPHPPGWSYAYDISANGAIIVGQWYGFMNASLQRLAVTWQGAGLDYVVIGDLPGGNANGKAAACSADGGVVAGTGVGATLTQAFRWTERAGMIPLGVLGQNPNGNLGSTGEGVSGDGMTVVGRSTSAEGYQAFRWSEGLGMQALGWLAGGDDSIAQACSHEGSVIVGYCELSPGNAQAAFRWHQATGMQLIGPAVSDAFRTRAHDVSSDGTLILGVQVVIATSGSTISPVMWQGDSPMRLVRDVLQQDYGIALPAGWVISNARCSPDGKVLVGSVKHGTALEGWVAVLFEPDTNGDGAVNVTDLLALIGSWGSCVNCETDITRDGSVNIDDLLLIINNWG